MNSTESCDHFSNRQCLQPADYTVSSILSVSPHIFELIYKKENGQQLEGAVYFHVPALTSCSCCKSGLLPSSPRTRRTAVGPDRKGDEARNRNSSNGSSSRIHVFTMFIEPQHVGCTRLHQNMDVCMTYCGASEL